MKCPTIGQLHYEFSLLKPESMSKYTSIGYGEFNNCGYLFVNRKKNTGSSLLTYANLLLSSPAFPRTLLHIIINVQDR